MRETVRVTWFPDYRMDVVRSFEGDPAVHRASFDLGGSGQSISFTLRKRCVSPRGFEEFAGAEMFTVYVGPDEQSTAPRNFMFAFQSSTYNERVIRTYVPVSPR